MSQRRNLTDSEAWRVVGRLEGGQTQAEIAQVIGVSQSLISRIWNRFLETGSAGRRPGQGCRRATTPNEDRYLVLTARRHRNMNATLLQQHLRSATGTRVSTQTVRNRCNVASPNINIERGWFLCGPDTHTCILQVQHNPCLNPEESSSSTGR
ncbi:HTH_Tnp_Tc3_2 domain-containing protein [Trichonephila clavipes]|nr:HTH_Tnp_Tc3_2 domain-containing protein [Trichonephila clavipes]